MTDDELLGLVRAAFQAQDPVPRHVVADAQDAYQWWDADARLAKLTQDTDVRDVRTMAALRGGAGARLLRFESRDLAVEIEVTGATRTRELAGRLTPGADAEVRVRHARGQFVTQADDAGQFVLLDVPEGLVSLSFCMPDGTSAVTSWVRL